MPKPFDPYLIPLKTQTVMAFTAPFISNNWMDATGSSSPVFQAGVYLALSGDAARDQTWDLLHTKHMLYH